VVPRCASDLVILDAASMAEVAVLELPLVIPYGCTGVLWRGEPLRCRHLITASPSARSWICQLAMGGVVHPYGL
jgi:hypothetical protein